MTTINIHKDKLLPAAFAYQERKLKEINRMVYEFHEDSYMCKMLSRLLGDNIQEYVKLQTACRVDEDGIVSLDIDVVQRIFGEE